MIRNLFSGALRTLNSFSDDVSTLYKLCTLSSGFSFKLYFPSRSRRCGKSGCMGYKNATECQLIIKTGECLKSGGKAVEEVDQLPRKELTKEKQTVEYLVKIVNHIYVLREMAPKNGRAVMLFRDKCGCPYAKLERWGSEKPSHEEKRLLSGAEEPSHEVNKRQLDDLVIGLAEKSLKLIDLLKDLPGETVEE